ncbi:hypothetical protein QN391_22740 [Pseudomonas sp. CCI1.2]|uniref:ImmA/IrrE family metallo-endopeptidase n=1 Tax=Pseudomonas sp. CCI1.2 TaxID=3048614 RepID=UPI002B23276B|nr:hypothetical protein [Pseudomonas sp. CCI1.2]MEB0123479.1 hypothetical protein [Pseudomonas sp. CCI1.2]
MRTVRCDLRFLDELIDGLSLIYSEHQRTELRIRLLQLVLAHELGHIFYHDVSGAYHGDQDGFSVIRYASYKVELRADAYAIRLIDSYAQNRELIYGDIVELASNSVRRSLCPQTFPAPCACAGYSDATLCSRVPLGPGLPISPDDRVPVKLVGTHPDYVVRFSRMLFLSKDPVARIYRNQAREVLRRVVVVNEGGQSESVDALLNTSQASPDVH